MLCAVVVATALVTAAAAQSSNARRLESPSGSEISRAASPIVDRQVAAAGASAVAPAGYWGGQYRTAAGELVTIYASNSYPVDPALGQRWADFLGSLVHGSEISTVTVLLATPTQIARVCGADAVACYSPQGAVLYTPGEDPGTDLSAEAVITHEYGHHVAANRTNAPWSALDSGPKRWASAMQVCARTRSGELFPGAEDPGHYTLNPGEGWAETYRVLNERKADDANRGLEHQEDSHLHGRDAARRHREDDPEAFGRDAPFRRRVRIVDARRPRRVRRGCLAHFHGLRGPELPLPRRRPGRARLR